MRQRSPDPTEHVMFQPVQRLQGKPQTEHKLADALFRYPAWFFFFHTFVFVETHLMCFQSVLKPA